MVRSSIREPVALGDGLVLLSGRVVHVEAGRALLEDTSGAVWLELGPSVGGPAAGDVVEVRGRLVGTAVAVDRLVVLARTHDGFPRAGSDHAWLTAGSRRRLEHLRRRAAVLTALRATMDAHHAGMPAPLWPSFLELPVSIDRTLDAPQRPDDEYAYWIN